MSVEDSYRERYKKGNTPWDLGKPDFNLIEIVTAKSIAGCKALDVGCGTGDNSIWLAQNGFQVVATDTSEFAINKAREKAGRAKVECDFRLLNFFYNEVEGAPFGFVLDRGCFHSFSQQTDQNRFASNIATHLDKAGLWLMIAGNADEDRQRPGPPQRSALEIVNAVEPFFEILVLESTHFGSQSLTPPRAWRCLMRKRNPA